MSNLPSINPVNTVYIDEADRLYVGTCAYVRINIERCAGSSVGVKKELDKLEASIGDDAKWLKSIYDSINFVIHCDWDRQGNMEWIKEVDIAVEGILEKLRR